MDPFYAVLVILTTLAMIYLLTQIFYPNLQTNCHVILFSQPPNDSTEHLTEEEYDLLQALEEEDFRVSRDQRGAAYRKRTRGPRIRPVTIKGKTTSSGLRYGVEDFLALTDDEEDFRISASSAGSMGTGGGPRIQSTPGRSSGGGGSWGGGGGWGGWDRGGWYPWPYTYHNRPWRTMFWRGYPEYIPTFPVTYYTDQWVSPVGRFTVRIGPKATGSKELKYYIGTGVADGTCGVAGPRIDLQRGRTYEFDIYSGKDCVTGDARDEPFFFTTDPEGGKQSGDVFAMAPIINGVVRITITDQVPPTFYYQSAKNKNVGGLVVVF